MNHDDTDCIGDAVERAWEGRGMGRGEHSSAAPLGANCLSRVTRSVEIRGGRAGSWP